MSIIGSIFVRLGLKSDEFSKGIKQSEGQLSSFKGVVGKIGGAIAGAPRSTRNVSKIRYQPGN